MNNATQALGYDNIPVLLCEEHSTGLLSTTALRLIMRDRSWGCDNIPVLLFEEQSPGPLSMRVFRLIMRDRFW